MNNDQFRKLVLANAGQSSGKKNAPEERRVGTGSLGSRERSSIPMTPRSVASSQSVFARQVAERNQAVHSQKKFKASAPKGVKLASGYVDRARERQDEPTDDRGKRLAALDKSFQEGQIEKAAYDKLRFEIAGGSLDSTHLVKGLDFKLLERIRRGEDIYGRKTNDTTGEPEKDESNDVEDALHEIEQSEVKAIERDRTVKKTGQLATAPVSGKKRTRDQILAELKASREAAKAQKESSLGSKFRKIGTKQKPGTRIERDGKGREVLIIVDEDGREKRKVRKLQPREGEDVPGNGLLMPDPKAKPLGMEVPEKYRQRPEPEDDLDGDIFEGVGDDYDPLADLNVSDSDSSTNSNADAKERDAKSAHEAADEETKPESATMPPPPKPAAIGQGRNYFAGSKTGLLSEKTTEAPSASDPALMAAIKRAAALRRIEDDSDKDEGRAEAQTMEERRRRLEQMKERDDDDLDMGFGTSRFEDEEDFDDRPVKLSAWDGSEGAAGRAGQTKRKRGPKKRKGDANSAADVMRVMEQRKQS
ncbi:hypothetical protein XA68_11881 [Ophiocordyceps unilateralis]|uniref:RED-like N-terminal domain-containing protein n=1 Tax=Ophiocordyceps unilateralis TaxID=268505 RepID=A0A2A9PFW0_OPHUN|nr:hypothetical protein XA68_11881 [Ophiocordyceps unilateralis]